jgi:hypothetical protein
LSDYLSLTTVFGFLIFAYFLFIQKAGKLFPVLYLFVFTYFLQYVFSVYLIYTEYPLLKALMVIKQEQYFDYALPALFFFFAGVFIFNKNVSLVDLLTKIDKESANKLGILLIGISYSFDFASFLGLPAIGSFVSFTTYLKYVGAMALFFSPSLQSYILISITYISLTIYAVRGGVFIDFFVWSTYYFLIVCLKFKLSFLSRSMFAVCAIPVLIFIQSVKLEYRKATWSGRESSGLETLSEVAEKQSLRTANQEERKGWANTDGVVRTVGRLNQGWHLGKVLRWVPQHRAFSDGDELIGDIEGTLLPRVFFPNKKVIGAQDKFREFTGHKLRGSTSMTIGVLGDFYINFGREGSFVGLFIFGAVVSRLLYGFVKKDVLGDPINFVWIPFLFSYLIRANNDFYIVINSFVKGYIIFLAVTFIRKRM